MIYLEGVGPKTVRALSLVAEIIYGAEASRQDPARYFFVHGGKDAMPYPVDRFTYDRTIDFFNKIIQRTRLFLSEKRKVASDLVSIG